MNTLTFESTQLTVTDHLGQPWLAAKQLAKALGYKDADSITKIYNRNKDEFCENMTGTVKLTVPTVSLAQEQETRIFSPRGCHLLAMFSRTKLAKQFRKWVLDVLDKEQPKTLTPAQQRHVQERVNELVHGFKDNNHQLQYAKIKTKFRVGSYKDILAVDYPKVCRFLSCIPRVELPKDEQVQNMQQLPFLDERILFTWENGVLVDSRPMASNEMTTTKDRILRLVLMHDFTTVDERLALIVALNADIAQNVKDLSGALRSSRKKH